MARRVIGAESYIMNRTLKMRLGFRDKEWLRKLVTLYTIVRTRIESQAITLLTLSEKGLTALKDPVHDIRNMN